MRTKFSLTYFRFHLWFNFPVLLALWVFTRNQPWSNGELTALAIVLVVVMIFTAPWDNWAAKEGIWGFPREKYGLSLGYLPLEEYLFFILQSLNVILSVRLAFAFLPKWQTHLETPLHIWQGMAALFLLMIWVGYGWKTGWHSPIRRFRYAYHLLFWFVPIILLQWLIAPYLFWAHSPLLLLITVFWGIYYSLCDVVAVRHHVWFFDHTQITGLLWRNILPWEEIAFFFLTSLLVAQSYLLLLPPSAR